ncbi:MAG: AMP-binding acetyl-CoA synthetase [Myxococcaceae bacterium]|nr:AMP-binding acetyl-CoA synthetase [Myxococcaceae bacterium]
MQIEPSDLVLARAYTWEKQRPDEIYMTQPLGGGAVRTYTWAQTLDEARRMAAYLQSFGFPPGSKIALLSKNCAHFVMTDLAIWMAGYVSVALYPTLQPQTVRYILEHSEAKLIFIGKLDGWDAMKAGVPEGLARVSFPLSPPNDYPTWDKLVKITPPIAGQPLRSLDETALLVYTSGSTGQPKGVEQTFRSVAAVGKGAGIALSVTRRDRFISYLPLAHVFERGCVESLTLYVGAKIFFADSLDTFVEDVKRARPTVFHSVPRLWLKFHQGVLAKLPKAKLERALAIPLVNRIVKFVVLKGLGLHSARLAISGSAPIPPDLISWYRSLGLELLEGYGMTENFAYSHVSLPGKSRVGYVGNTMPGVQQRISPEGEVLIKSGADMKGYYKQPELTRSSFTEDGFLKTGDRGEIDSEGRLKLTGRVKELFKTSKGKYVAPAPIENLLNNDDNLEMCCVSGSGEPQPFAFVVLAEQLRKKLKKGGERTAVQSELTQLLRDVNEKVEEHEQLAFLVVVDDDWQIENGFLTPTLKIKRDVVESTYQALVPGWYAKKLPVVWQA